MTCTETKKCNAVRSTQGLFNPLFLDGRPNGSRKVWFEPGNPDNRKEKLNTPNIINK